MTIQDLLQTQTDPAKARAVAVLQALHPDEEIAGWSPWFVNWRMNEVLDVLDEKPVPTLSRIGRDAIKAAAQTLSELGS